MTTTASNTGSVTVTTVTNSTSTVNSVTNITSTATVNTTTIGETAYTYMRAKTVEFTASGLKPNTQYYPFFNRVYIGNHCSTVDGQVSSVIKTNALGDIKGKFYIPTNTFLCGSYTFSLVDNVVVSGDTYLPDPIYGQAEAQYEANGTLKTQQTQVTINSVANTSTTVSTVSTATTTAAVAVNVNPVIINTPTPVVVPITNPTPVVQCETWYFDYTVTTGVTTRTFTIISNSRTPPAASSLSPGSGGVPNGFLRGSIQYLSSTSSASHLSLIWRHTYSGLAGSASGGGTIKKYRQYWTGRTTDARPSLSGWRPSGLSSTSTVAIDSSWIRSGVAACPVRSGLGSTLLVSSTSVAPYYDPVAQSFFVDTETYPEGIFVSTIGTFFRTVDQSTPVVLEIRNMVNGLPGSQVFPGGRVLMPGSAVSASPNATVETFFKFDYPVFLMPGQEYCFVIRSTSLGYNLWSSKMGERDVTDNKVIDANPYGGTMFTSENNYTWSPDPSQDLKFNMYVAEFDITKTADVVVRPQANAANSLYFGTAQHLPLSFMSTEKGSKIITATIPMHGLSTDDSIFIEGIGNAVADDETIGYNNILAADLNGMHTVSVIDEDTVTFTSSGTNTASKTGPLSTSDKRLPINVAPPVPLIEQTITPAQPVIFDDNLSPSTLPVAQSLTSPTSPSIANTTTFIVYTNIPVNEVMVDYLGTEFDQTSITEFISLASGKSIAGSETPYGYRPFEEIQDSKAFHTFNQPRLLATPSNESKHTFELLANKSAVVNIKLSSSNKNVSPTIDVTGMSLIAKTYVIDNQNDELSSLATESDFNDPSLNSEINPGTGKALAKYKTIVRNLTDFHDKITVFVTGNCPSPAVIDAYIRTSTDSETHQDRDWVWTPINGVFGTSFTNSSDRFVTNEWMYELSTEEPFNVYDIKLVMRSTNTSIVPKIYGVRTITQFA